MVKIITNKEELIKEISGKNSVVRLKLSPEDIDKWKMEGRFRFIRDELCTLHNLKLGCIKKENGFCHYYFFVSNDKLGMRILNMIQGIFDGKLNRLGKCSHDASKVCNGIYYIDGDLTVCNLF